MVISETQSSLIEQVVREAKRAEQDAEYKKSLGLRPLSENEKKFYEMLKGGAKQALTAAQIDIIPIETIDKTLEDVRTEYPILQLITFAPPDVKHWLTGAKTGGHAWGSLAAALSNSAELSATLTSLNIEVGKLYTYCIIPKSIRDLEIGYVDRYFRAILQETIYDGIVDGYLNGTGKDAPIGILKQIIAPAEKVVPMMNGIIAGVVPGGFLAFNMFVDLFLCTLMMFLLNVQPKRWFTGKKVLILRFAVIIPIAYEGFCFWLKIQAMRGKVMLPMWSYPLLTMKPPVMILLFIVMAFVVKIREYRYCKHGNTHEDYQAFMQTNRNSFHLSVRLAILMVIFAVLDLALLVLLTYLNADSAGAVNAAGEMAEEASDTFVSLSLAVGIGKSWPIGLLAPFMLLFSYNKEPKNKMISMVLPAVAIVLCIFIVLEATRMGVGMIMNGKQINVDEVGQMLKSLAGE